MRKKLSPTFLILVFCFGASAIWAASIASVHADNLNLGRMTNGGFKEGIAIFLFVVLGWLVSICLHEFAHAFVAFRGGDVSAKARGYLTLDPVKYLDPLTSIGIPLLMLLIGGFALPGAAVFIQRNSIRTKRMRSIMSLAGPAANLVCFFLAGLGIFFTANSGSALFYGFVVLTAFQGMAVFLNLLPIPGLDGWGALLPWLPNKIAKFGQRYQNRIFWIFVFILILPGASADLQGLFGVINEFFGAGPYSTEVGFGLFRFWN